MAVAVVGVGGAGQSIAKIFAEKYSFNVYAMSDVKNFENFFDFKDLEKAIRDLEAYDSIILAAGLGGRGGDYLVKLAEKLNTAAIFVCMPFKVERRRVENARRQLSKLSRLSQKNIFVRELDNLFERMPDASLLHALEVLDNEIADEIAEFAKKLE